MTVSEPQPTGDGSRSPCWKKTFGRLSRQLVDLPSSLHCRALSESKTTLQKLTVFRAAANRSAAFQSGWLGCVGPASAHQVVTPGPSVTETEKLPARPARLRCSKPGLTRRSLVSTLKQSPESRRYGCDPSTKRGGCAGYQARHKAYRGVVWGSVTHRHGKPGRTRCQMQQGESRGKGQADLPAE
jgi:hypothetical protein